MSKSDTPKSESDEKQIGFGTLIGSIFTIIILQFLQQYPLPTSPTKEDHIETFTITLHREYKEYTDHRLGQEGRTILVPDQR